MEHLARDASGQNKHTVKHQTLAKIAYKRPINGILQPYKNQAQGYTPSAHRVAHYKGNIQEPRVDICLQD